MTTSDRQIPNTADVVIIGGGPAGTAALWALECLAPGIKSVLLEKDDHLGAGSSLASLEAYRTCWTSECLAQQMRRCVEILHHADDYFGDGASDSIAAKEQGYLFCGFTENEAATLKADVEHLHRMGMSYIEYLDADDMARRFPWVGGRAIAGKFDPIAGWLDSNALIHRMAQAAKSAQIIFGVQDARIVVESGKVAGVQTANGFISSRKVLIAAGAASGSIGRSAGVELPIVVIPRQSFTTGWRHDGFPAEAPMLIGASPFPHVRPEAGTGAIFGWEYRWNSKFAAPDDPVSEALIEPVFPVTPLKDARFPSIVLALLARQFGHQDGVGFASSRYLSGIHHNIGYYVYRDAAAAYVTRADGTTQPYESQRAILDAHPDVEGLYVSTAHVGHGIMTAPAGGEIIACHILERELPHPAFADFGINVPWVEHDESVL